MGIGIITALSNLFSGRNFSTITDKQELALVDALTFAMAADHEVSDTEQQELVKSLRVLDWEQKTSLESYVEHALAKAREKVAEQNGALAYCTDISRRLGEDWLREETYYLAGRISATDHDVNAGEQAYLRAMVEAFAIDNDTHARITNQLMREMHF
jgi:hypothetical protein